MLDKPNPFQSPQTNGRDSSASNGEREPTRKQWFAALSTAVYIGALLFPLTWLAGVSILKSVIGSPAASDSLAYKKIVIVSFWAVMLIPSVVVGRMIFNSKLASEMGSNNKSDVE